MISIYEFTVEEHFDAHGPRRLCVPKDIVCREWAHISIDLESVTLLMLLRMPSRCDCQFHKLITRIKSWSSLSTRSKWATKQVRINGNAASNYTASMCKVTIWKRMIYRFWNADRTCLSFPPSRLRRYNIPCERPSRRSSFAVLFRGFISIRFEPQRCTCLTRNCTELIGVGC